MKNQRILMTAYAVNPFKGSEDGTGWNITREVAKSNQVTVITRKNNIPHIEKYLKENPNDVHSGTKFIGYDLHPSLMWLKKRLGERGYVLYYYFWQFFLPLFIKTNNLQFDIVHAVNFHSDSVPTFLWALGKPTYWGPIGHHPKVPKAFLKEYNRINYIKDRLYFALKWSLRNLDPFFKLAVKKADKIFVINSSIAKTIGAPAQKTVLVPAVAGEKHEVEKKSKQGFKVLSVGRFHYMKGFDLTIRAFAHFVNQLTDQEKEQAELILVGKGEEKERLIEIAKSEGIMGQVRWVDWVDHSEMKKLYLESKVFLFPSHEGAGMVIPEALSFGLPVVCLDNYGPGELAGNAALKVAYDDYEQVVAKLGDAIAHLYSSKILYTKLSNKARERFHSHFSWKAKGETITAAYQLKPTKKVAVFHPSSELYGADRILINAIQAMPDEVHKTVYLKFEGPLAKELETKTKNTEVKITPYMPVIYREIFNPKGILKFSADWFKFAAFMRKEMRKNRFKSAYINTLSTTFILPIVKWMKMPAYVHVHEIIESPKMIGKLTAVLCHWFAQHLICVSEAVKKNMLRYVGVLEKKAVVIHNGIEAIDVPEKKLNGKVNFYLFGRIMEKKGQWFLIEALKGLSESERKQVRFTLMGGAVPGKESTLEELKNEINESGLEQVVELKEFAPDISQAMAKADVCLVPSLMKDPFPTTVLEAMSAGKPVIATDHGGAKEAISNSGGGFLIKAGMTDQLVGSIRSLLQKKSDIPSMGLRAKERFLSAFTKEHFNQNWSNFLLKGELV